MSDELPEVLLVRDLDAWVEREIEAGEQVPDFWYDCQTSERLAAYLTSLGWSKR